MKLAISGTQCVGKSTLIEDFLNTWPMYKKADQSYRERIKKDLKINQDGDEESQLKIRNALIDQAQKYSKKDNVIFDRCLFDNLAYTLWLNYNKKISDLFVEQQIVIFKESLKFYDIIFFIPITKKDNIKIVPAEDGSRDLDPKFRVEIDNIMKALHNDYLKQGIPRIFFPSDNCPAVIDIAGTREERIQQIKLYVNNEGKSYGEDDSLLKTDMSGLPGLPSFLK